MNNEEYKNANKELGQTTDETLKDYEGKTIGDYIEESDMFTSKENTYKWQKYTKGRTIMERLIDSMEDNTREMD